MGLELTMNECKRHPLRKRKDCPECQGIKPDMEVKEREIPKNFNSIKVGNKKPVNEIPNPEITIKHFVHKEPEVIESEVTVKEVKSEGDKIANYIDKIINDRIGNIKKELAGLSSIRWEHLIVPSMKFNVNLLIELEEQGWAYCNTLISTKEHQYGFEGSCAIFKRIISKNNKPIPNHLKVGNKCK